MGTETAQDPSSQVVQASSPGVVPEAVLAEQRALNEQLRVHGPHVDATRPGWVEAGRAMLESPDSPLGGRPLASVPATTPAFG